MKKRRIKKKAVFFSLLFLILMFFVFLMGIYFYFIGPVNKNGEKKDFEVPKESTYLTIASALKEEGLIKNEFVYKIYIKLNRPTSLQAGTYQLSSDMSLKEIVQALSQVNTYNPDAVTLTVPEGKHLEQVAEIASTVTNHTKEELLKAWDEEEFVKKVIEQYWFVTDEVLEKNIRHPLEGYFFPSTYELKNADVEPSYIAYKMLDQMDKVLTKYKEDIEKSKYTVHELLTMASIVEYEAILDEDRPIVAGVFYNRLKINMKLQSCATLGYAIDNWKLTYTYSDMNVASPYNTYFYTGLPVGPGGMPSEESIKAAIYPATHDYYYFMANVCDTSSQKTYFAKTLSEHNANVKKYLTCF